jgi:hypothetical protein
MYINSDYSNSISFNARLGANLRLKLLNDDFGGDVKRLEKFEKLFNDTFEKNIDANTVVDITKGGRFSLSNPIAPKVTVPMNVLYKNKSLAQRMLHECDRVYASVEYRLFKKIISKKYNSGKSLEKISELSKKLDKRARLYFMDLIGTAERILKENPDSKLTELEFLTMSNIQMQEIINSPSFQEAMAKGGFPAAVRVLRKS